MLLSTLYLLWAVVRGNRCGGSRESLPLKIQHVLSCRNSRSLENSNVMDAPFPMLNIVILWCLFPESRFTSTTLTSAAPLSPSTASPPFAFAYPTSL